jgi:hypothetical protein
MRTDRRLRAGLLFSRFVVFTVIMKSGGHIVHQGLWIKLLSSRRPKTTLFAVLSLVWFGVCAAASGPFWFDSWPPSFSRGEWLCLSIMLPEPIFIFLTIKNALTEQPKTSPLANPRHDLRKLY